MEWIYANDNHSTIVNEKNGVIYLTFPKLAAAGVRHGFSTRMGGGQQRKSRNDESVIYPGRPGRRMCGKTFAGSPMPSDLRQKTWCFLPRFMRQASEGDKRKPGRGNSPGDGAGIDGLVTNEPGVPLYTSYADCVPLLFYDPEQKVIAMAHSGWRGTAARIGAKMIHLMEEEYGSQAENIIAAIGPSICRACYEVSEDVWAAFGETFSAEQLPQIFDNK